MSPGCACRVHLQCQRQYKEWQCSSGPCLKLHVLQRQTKRRDQQSSSVRSFASGTLAKQRQGAVLKNLNQPISATPAASLESKPRQSQAHAAVPMGKSKRPAATSSLRTTAWRCSSSRDCLHKSTLAPCFAQHPQQDCSGGLQVQRGTATQVAAYDNTSEQHKPAPPLAV